MSKNALNGNLNEFKNKVKEKWENLTESDSASLTGDVDQLANMLQERLGYAKDQAATAAQEFIKGFKNTGKGDGKDSDSSMMKGVGQAAGKIGEIGKDVCEKTADMAKTVKEEAGEYGKAVVDFVEHKPYQSLAIAALAGLTLGLLVKRH